MFYISIQRWMRLIDKHGTYANKSLHLCNRTCSCCCCCCTRCTQSHACRCHNGRQTSDWQLVRVRLSARPTLRIIIRQPTVARSIQRRPLYFTHATLFISFFLEAPFSDVFNRYSRNFPTRCVKRETWQMTTDRRNISFSYRKSGSSIQWRCQNFDRKCTYISENRSNTAKRIAILPKFQFLYRKSMLLRTTVTKNFGPEVKLLP